MKNSKNKVLPGLVVAACAACCVIPIAGLIWAGAGSAAIASYFTSGMIRELLICGVPLLVIIGGFYFFRRHKASCCPDTKSNCTTNQCGVNPKE